MQETITGWPGGKPDEKKRPGDIRRTTDTIFPKRVLIFSPHPDDDVISMGGTLIRLVDQGHEVHVAYQTSGNIAVFDDDASRFVDFALEFARLFGTAPEQVERIEQQIEEFLRNKKPGQVDSPEVQQIKGLIRRGEARAASRDCGVPDENIHFLDMPFYETGTVRKKPLGEDDIRHRRRAARTGEAAPDLRRRRPLRPARHAPRLPRGDLPRRSSGSSTRTGSSTAKSGSTAAPGRSGSPKRSRWPSRSAPKSCCESATAIFKHQSQKDKAMFPGVDEREFWQRAEDRNRATAKLYDRLGLAEYEAIEGFVRWRVE